MPLYYFSFHGRGATLTPVSVAHLAKVPNVAVSLAGPYIFHPNCRVTKPVYLTAITESRIIPANKNIFNI